MTTLAEPTLQHCHGCPLGFSIAVTLLDRLSTIVDPSVTAFYVTFSTRTHAHGLYSMDLFA